MMSSEALLKKGVRQEAADTLVKFANMGLTQTTWSSYKTVDNHIKRCQEDTGVDLSFPFSVDKTLTLVAWMMDKRKIRANSIDKYLSGLRMLHLTQGFDAPRLRDPIVKLILTGRSNWDNIKDKLEGRKQRDPVTLDMMKFFKKKLLDINWTPKKKILFHAVTTLA